MNLLNKLKEDRNELVAQVEDEKRKSEDLLFRLEEASITKDDIEVSILIPQQPKFNTHFPYQSFLFQKKILAESVSLGV